MSEDIITYMYKYEIGNILKSDAIRSLKLSTSALECHILLAIDHFQHSELYQTDAIA